jgi:hypothetical protein
MEGTLVIHVICLVIISLASDDACEVRGFLCMIDFSFWIRQPPANDAHTAQPGGGAKLLFLRP